MSHKERCVLIGTEPNIMFKHILNVYINYS